jgi:hypothetical protein
MEPVAVKGFGHQLSAAAIGRGTVRVAGRYGSQVTYIILSNVLHIPAARSNLISGPQLDRVGVTATLGNGLAILSFQGRDIIGGALFDDMYRLNLTIMRPTPSAYSLNNQIGSTAVVPTIGPITAAASSDQAGFYTA